MQFWGLPAQDNEQGSFGYGGMDSHYFIRAGMSIQRACNVDGKMVNLKFDDGDGLFSVHASQEFTSVLIELTCSPKISFFDELVVFDGGEAALRMGMDFVEVCSILFLHSQLYTYPHMNLHLASLHTSRIVGGPFRVLV